MQAVVEVLAAVGSCKISNARAVITAVKVATVVASAVASAVASTIASAIAIASVAINHALSAVTATFCSIMACPCTKKRC